MKFNKYLEEKLSPKKQKKFGKVMGEFGEGKLKTSAGKKVTDKKQAAAIAFSEVGESKDGKKKKKEKK
jgi:hypothetical protein